METVAPPPAEDELHLLMDWREPGEETRRRTATLGTVVLHIVAVVVLFLLPGSVFAPAPLREAEERIVTPLIAPLTQLTQKAPNTGPINKEFNALEMKPRPRVQIPAGRPSTNRPFALPPAAAVKPAAPAPLPEPPKVEAQIQAPKNALQHVEPAPPRIQAEEKPKLAFENVPPPSQPLPPGQRRVAIPDASVAQAIRGSVQSGGAGLTVGDEGLAGPGGYGEGINLPPAPGSRGNNLQLLSDPLGVDFRPYLTRILASVRRHWLAVLPESAKMGRQGRVAIQFSISRDGEVPKLVIAESSGADALDRAAVAGVSASVPFPPLPSEFKGPIIKLQFNFAYNMPRQ